MATKPNKADDPYAIVQIDTAKLNAEQRECCWMDGDGPSQECGGIVEMELGTFIEAMEKCGVIL